MREIKSCPFCGDFANLYTRHIRGVLGPVKRYLIRCGGCKISTTEVDDDDSGCVVDDLIDLWNKRQSK